MNLSRLLQHKNAYSRMLLIFIACMLPFTLMRLVLYLVYHDDFRSLGVLQVIESFAVGLRPQLAATQQHHADSRRTERCTDNVR